MSDSSYSVDSRAGRIVPAVQLGSPNCDARPEGVPVDLLILHGISLPPGEFGTGAIASLFQNRLDHSAHPYFEEIRGLKVSSHLLIDRHGAVAQFVSLNDRAWHAGVSCFRGRSRCNDYAIGIELEGTDDAAYTDEQYATLGPVITAIAKAYPGIDARKLAAHSDVSPGRKTDPGPAFDWQRLYDALLPTSSA